MDQHKHECHSHAADPVVEGSDFIEIRDTTLDTAELTKIVESTKAGAISTFLGVTRDHHAGKKVLNDPRKLFFLLKCDE